MTLDDYVYSRIGMALVSAQRVEFITSKLLDYLIEYDQAFYGISTEEFLSDSEKYKKQRKHTLGRVFHQLKLNPKLVLADELDSYLAKRNILVHYFWKDYLHYKTKAQTKKIIDFCYDFGRQSTNLESFFKGFLYFLALRHVENKYQLKPQFKQFELEFYYFMFALDKKKLLDFS